MHSPLVLHMAGYCSAVAACSAELSGSIIALMSIMLHPTCNAAMLCLSSKPVLPAFLSVQRGGERCQG